MKDIIIFGRSPFINRLDLAKLDYDRFDVCCINKPIKNIKTKYLVSADAWVKPELDKDIEWVSIHSGWKIIKTDNVIQHEGKLSWKHYSSDLAVNFAILRGYKNIYLAGIDLIPDGKGLVHYDGVVNEEPTNPEGTIDAQNIIKLLAEMYRVNIYNVNPSCDWLEYRDIGLMLE